MKLADLVGLLVWRRLHSLGASEHSCDHQTIWRSQSHTNYTVPCHSPATSLSRAEAKSLQSSLNLHFLFGASRFFTGGSAIAYPKNVENSARNHPENAGDYPNAHFPLFRWHSWPVAGSLKKHTRWRPDFPEVLDVFRV